MNENAPDASLERLRALTAFKNGKRTFEADGDPLGENAFRHPPSPADETLAQTIQRSHALFRNVAGARAAGAFGLRKTWQP